MTDMEILRNSLFDEIQRLKRGTSTPEESNALCKVANSIISTYDTELKSIDTMIRVQEAGANVPQLKTFKDNSDNEIEHKD